MPLLHDPEALRRNIRGQEDLRFPPRPATDPVLVRAHTAFITKAAPGCGQMAFM